MAAGSIWVIGQLNIPPRPALPAARDVSAIAFGFGPLREIAVAHKMGEVRSSVKAYTHIRHKPEETTLYKVVQNNWLTFQEQVEQDTGYPLPDFVVKEFNESLRCGILAHGFLRAQCESCHFEHLVAFSCKRRGFCPSCGARRMSKTAAHLVDSVLPEEPIRQWVLSFPFQIRLCLAVRPKIMARALAITHHAIAKHYLNKAGLQKSNGKAGAVTLIQRFGGSLNLNVHFHQLFIDGCYELGPKGEPIRFIATEPPTHEDLDQVLAQIIRRLTRYLIRQQIIVRDNDNEFQLEIPADDTFSRLQASSVTYRFATGPSKDKKALTLKTVPDGDHSATYGLVTKCSGFSLHAGVATKKPWSDGTSAIKLTQLEMMERLAALVPRPRVHLTRFHGVLGPNYKYRQQIVPKKNAELTPAVDDDTTHPADSDKPPASARRIAWAQLLKRVFNIDITVCSLCRGNIKVIAAIEDPKVIKKILNHMGLPSTAPILKPARGPPTADQNEPQQEFFET